MPSVTKGEEVEMLGVLVGFVTYIVVSGYTDSLPLIWGAVIAAGITLSMIQMYL